MTIDIPELAEILEEMAELDEYYPHFVERIERLLAKKRDKQRLTFIGVYNQGTNMFGMLVPFVFFQLPLQEEALIAGRLEATCHDIAPSSIDGVMTFQNTIMFEKHYADKINPFSIDYNGRLSERGFYEGIWSFNPPVSAQKLAVAREGRFRLKHLQQK